MRRANVVEDGSGGCVIVRYPRLLYLEGSRLSAAGPLHSQSVDSEVRIAGKSEEEGEDVG